MCTSIAANNKRNKNILEIKLSVITQACEHSVLLSICNSQSQSQPFTLHKKSSEGDESIFLL
jgi:hypothetical protein